VKTSMKSASLKFNLLHPKASDLFISRLKTIKS
jgi:hypothetical protein